MAKGIKKKGVKKPIKTTAEKEGLDISGEGLKLSWINFIDAYIANGGNGTKAYVKAYSTEEKQISENVARAAAPRLLANVSIREELNNRLKTQKCTDEFIISGLMGIAIDYRGAKTINAAVKSYEILAKVRGLLVDTKKIAFTGENPAVFLPVYSKEEKEKFDKIKKDKQRIVE